ncbi:MAG: hypothetical protein NC412_06360 [Roseburia sp.]|nr:hypothetical protein [Roseburia sp.]MCM1278443.1 hypothetical protein [Robinsoniella sp.]
MPKNAVCDDEKWQEVIERAKKEAVKKEETKETAAMQERDFKFKGQGG